MDKIRLLLFLALIGTAHAQTINNLPPATLPLGGTEAVPIVQGGITKQAPASALGAGGGGGGGGGAGTFSTLTVSGPANLGGGGTLGGTFTGGTFQSPVVTGSFTATGLVTNADLTNPFVTINGVQCTLGSISCTISATAGSITVGTTSIVSGTSGNIEYNNGGVLGELAHLPYANLTALSANQVVGALTATTPSGLSVPSCSATGDALLWTSGTGFGCATGYAPLASPTFTGTVTLPAASVTNSELANSTISGIALGSNLDTLTFGTHLASGGSSFNGSANVTITSDATNANTASTIVARDSSGNFSAGTITAAVTGHASSDLPLTGGTLTGELTTVASATGGAGFNLPQGAAPTSPNNGDVWTTSSGLFARINGTTVGPYGTGSGTGCSVTGSQFQILAVNSAGTGCTPDSSGSINLGTLTLGASGTLGDVVMGNATSGTITLEPVTGALGSVTVSIPAITDTLVTLTATQTLTNKSIAGSEINSGTVGGTYGGTGVNNGASTITIAGNVTFSGAHTFTGTLSANTAVTFPTAGTLAILGANTFTGEQTTAASASGGAGFNLPQGTAPSSPNNGDLWTTSSGVFAQINGATVGPFGSGLSSLAANQVLGSLTATIPTGQSVPSCSATGDALNWTSGTGFGCFTGYAPLASPTFTGTLSASGGEVNLTNGTSNYITWGTNGQANPGSASAGEKLQLYGTPGTLAATDYSEGVAIGTIITPTSGGSLTDSNSDVYTMNTGGGVAPGQILLNGTAIPGSQGTNEIILVSGTIWAESITNGNWFTFTPPSTFTLQQAMPPAGYGSWYSSPNWIQFYTGGTLNATLDNNGYFFANELIAGTNLWVNQNGTVNGTFNPAGGILGATGGVNQAAGNVGEYPNSNVASGSAVSLSNGIAANVTSVSLTAGDWDCSGAVGFTPAATTTVNTLAAFISKSSGTIPTPTNSGGEAQWAQQTATVLTNGVPVLNIGNFRVLISTTTTVYLEAESTFGTSTNKAYGFIGCRRRD